MGFDSKSFPIHPGACLDWLIVSPVVIQTDSDWRSTLLIVCSRLTESHFIRQPSVSSTAQHEHGVQSSSVTACLHRLPHKELFTRARTGSKSERGRGGRRGEEESGERREGAAGDREIKNIWEMEKGSERLRGRTRERKGEMAMEGAVEAVCSPECTG
ncbi:unnamed protein product [Pleuronectes platessa]|uniref:Uncharacterized protein n=1 Tax=Pleuronectes platessa TaxID=8262 RepID=A0A9N7YW81_PLEPL|nr:unnamed protein product [Pleuronectes platessa]